MLISLGMGSDVDRKAESGSQLELTLVVNSFDFLYCVLLAQVLIGCFLLFYRNLNPSLYVNMRYLHMKVPICIVDDHRFIHLLVRIILHECMADKQQEESVSKKTFLLCAISLDIIHVAQYAIAQL